VMLRAGLSEASTAVDVRRVVILSSCLIGMTAYDEYFPLVARGHGVDTATVPYLIGLVVVGQAVGTAAAGRTMRMPSRAMALVVVSGGALISWGALFDPLVGFAAIAVGYGLLNNTMIVSEARLQEVITGPARATVTSVHGLATEVVALAVYAAFALAADPCRCRSSSRCSGSRSSWWPAAWPGGCRVLGIPTDLSGWRTPRRVHSSLTSRSSGRRTRR